MNTQITELYEKHLSETFPRGYGGEEIEGIDLVLLGADTAGCVSTFIHNDGSLDLCRTAILGICYRDLSFVVNKLDGVAKEYFSLLEKMADLVLREIILKEYEIELLSCEHFSSLSVKPACGRT